MRNDVDVAAAVLGGKSAKQPKLSLREMSIRRGHGGGFIAKHQLDDENGNPHHQTHEYPLSSHGDLIKHIGEHFADEKEGGSEEKAEKGKAAAIASARNGAPGKAETGIEELD